MAWQARITAPPIFSLADEFAALITGDPSLGWLAAWIPYIGTQLTVTDAFCAAGPPLASTNTADDFASPTPLDAADWLTQGARTAKVVRNIARERVFSAYCYDPAGAAVGVWGPSECQAVGPNSPTPFANIYAYGVAPAGTTHVRYQWSGWVDRTNPWPVDFNEFTPANTNLRHWQQGTGTMVGTLGGWITQPFNAGDHLVVYQYTDSSGVICVEYDATDGTYHTTTAQPQPTGLVAPGSTVPSTLAGIAAEAQRLELKLDVLMNWIQGIAGATVDLGGTPDPPAAIAPNTPTTVADAVGCIVTLSNIPASRSLVFGTPQNVVKCGFINLGSAAEWYPSIPISHTPFIIRPFPPGTKRVTITDLPPGTTATLALIPKEK